MTIAARDGAPRPAAPPRVHAFPGPSCCVAAGPAARGLALPPPAVPSARVPGVMRWAGAPDAGRVTAHSPSEASAAPAPPKSSIVEKTSKAFVSGTISGWGQTLAGQPFDTVKVRLQANPGQYTGPMQCFMDCVKREGFTGLYKGTMAPMLGIGFCNALQFAGYEWSKERIEDGLRRQQAASGAAGAAGDAAGRTSRPLTLGEVRAPRNRRRDARGPAALGRACSQYPIACTNCTKATNSPFEIDRLPSSSNTLAKREHCSPETAHSRVPARRATTGWAAAGRSRR